MDFERRLAWVARGVGFAALLGLLSTLSWIVYGVYLLS